MSKYLYAFGCLVLGIASVATPGFSAAQPDLDPAALDLLKQTVGSITNAKTYSLKVVVARDRLATNDQLVTYFNDDTVTVSRPNKLRIDVDGEHNDVQFFYDGKTATLFNPEHKLYVTHPASSTIDGMLDVLEKRGVTFPINDLIASNSYDSLVKGLQTAYVIGRVDINQKTFIHLVFTEPSTDWQLWIEPGDKPLPRAMTIIYKKEPGSPRITMDFKDWNLNAEAPASTFEFVKPSDAHEIDFLPPQKAGK
jgi:hypothetical protein